ncbi:hypothetical protein YC2023_004669 [Brassica napus]
MLPVACVETHGRPHALMHASFTCQKTAPHPDVSQHGWSACVATHRPLHVAPMHVYNSSLCLHSAADVIDRTSWPYA